MKEFDCFLMYLYTVALFLERLPHDKSTGTTKLAAQTASPKQKEKKLKIQGCLRVYRLNTLYYICRYRIDCCGAVSIAILPCITILGRVCTDPYLFFCHGEERVFRTQQSPSENTNQYWPPAPNFAGYPLVFRPGKFPFGQR